MMATYQDPPSFPQPVSREELGQNQTAYLTYFNTAFEKMYQLSLWFVGFIPWLESTKNTIAENANIAQNSSSISVSAKEDSVSAWHSIQGYIIPTDTSISIETYESTVDAILKNDLDLYLEILNLKGI
jgi:hypothetical protein